MGFASLTKFEAARKIHTQAVRAVYDKLLKADEPEARTAFPRQFEGMEAEWKKILAEHSFKNLDHSLKLLNEFAYGPGYVHVSNRTSDLARQLLRQILLCFCPRPDAGRPAFDPNAKILSDPDRVLTRLDNFVAAYGARATLFETWNSNPSLFELLLLLFDRSEFLAEVAIRTPDLGG